MSKSNKRAHGEKRKRHTKPYKGFPMFPHATGRWAKKIRQKLHYFGQISDDLKGEKALERLNLELPYLSEGRTPPEADSHEGCTLQLLCNAFLTNKKNKMDSGELSRHSFTDYYETCERIIKYFGRHRRVDDLRPDDFEGLRKKMAQGFSAVTLKNEINRCRIVLKFAYDQQLIKEQVRYGQSFDRPSAKTLRKARNAAGPRLFEAEELRKILTTDDIIMRAMVLLGVNCGFGNTDVASLPQSAVALESGWIDFPRPKTEVPRRIPLWRETVSALRLAISKRPRQPKNPADAGLCFLTVQGNRWVRVQPKRTDPDKFVTVNTVAHGFARILRKADINGRKGLGFYALRHVFETIGGESRDQVAVNAIMGHVDNTMASVYREGISDKRLRAVVDSVHEWLFSSNNEDHRE